MRRLARRGAFFASVATLALVSVPARASSTLEFPDNGVGAFSRGGAWLATATDPIAGFYNPAALSMQPTSLGVGANLALQKICFTREGTATSPATPTPSISATYPTSCNANSGSPQLVPNLAFTWRVNRELGVGLTVTPPAAYGALVWDDTAPTRNPPFGTQDLASGQRYLSRGVKATVLWPTLAAGYSVTDRLHVGAGFVAGIAILDLSSMSMSQVSPNSLRDDAINDTASNLKVKDLFVPGFVLSGLFEATDTIDIAAWYRWSDPIRAKGDLEVKSSYYDATGKRTARPTISRSDDQVGEDAASVTLRIPMEARIGARWHMPRRDVTPLEREGHRIDPYPTRDPLRDDLYDVELDLSWTNTGANQAIEVRFPEDPSHPGQSRIAVANLGFVPANADVLTGYRDTFGARLGGQYNVLGNKLGVRLGTWMETSATDAEHLTVTGVPAFRAGVGGGAVFRVGMVDLEAGYQHHFNAGFDNGGNGKLHAVAALDTSASPNFDYRSYHAVNGGKVTQSANVFAVGGVVRF